VILDAHRPQERYRIYRLREGQLDCVCATERAEHVVGAIMDQRDPEAGATLEDDDCIGILDAHGSQDANPLDAEGNYTLSGTWVVNPWATADSSTRRN
jgi:hypothetical protein